MSVLTNRPAARWLVPLAAAVAVLGGGAAIGALTAAADSKTTPRSASQLLVDLQTAKLDGLSGTVVQRSDLGLPALPGGGSGSADLTSLLSGTHTLRIWYAAPDKARVALLGTLGETDVITNGQDVWVWSSKENKATHSKVPARAGADATPMPSMSAFTPQQLAATVLRLLDKSTTVTNAGQVSVAGRSAEELVVAPKDPTSTIGSIRLAVDSTEHIPLRVQVIARGATSPAIEVAFTQISFTRPGDDQFTFNPPPGATVEEKALPDKALPDKAVPGTSGAGPKGDRPKIAMVGTGWSTVLVTAVPATTDDDQAKQLKTIIDQLPPVSGAWGSGHLVSSNLINVLITDDGRILVGAVRPDKLYAAAADPAAKLPK